VTDFKIGDWVCVTNGVDAGKIGQVTGNFALGDCRVDFGGKLGYVLRRHLRHLTPQEIAHIYAEEICNGS
jgi:hypothetical protein